MLVPRYNQVARETLVDACHELDISARDRDPDADAWVKLEHDLAELLFKAYIRNHTVDPD